MTLNMAPFPPLSEDEKTFLPVLNTFLANADNQGLRTIVAKHSRETEIVAKDLAALRDAFHTLQSQFNEDRRSGIELRGTVEKLQGANQELRACNSELRGVNEELRTTIGKLTDTNTTLRIAPERAMKQVDALEKKVDDALDTIVDKLETAVDNTRTANQDLRSRLDQLHVDTRVLKDLQRQMHQCDARLVSTEFRQQNVEEVVEKLANIINGNKHCHPSLCNPGVEVVLIPTQAHHLLRSCWCPEQAESCIKTLVRSLDVTLANATTLTIVMTNWPILKLAKDPSVMPVTATKRTQSPSQQSRPSSHLIWPFRMLPRLRA